MYVRSPERDVSRLFEEASFSREKEKEGNMIAFPDFSLGDLFWLCVKIVIASAVVRWAYVTVSNHWFHRKSRDDEDDDEDENEDKDEDEDEDEEAEETSEEVLVESEKVFHVGDVKSGG